MHKGTVRLGRRHFLRKPPAPGQATVQQDKPWGAQDCSAPCGHLRRWPRSGRGLVSEDPGKVAAPFCCPPLQSAGSTSPRPPRPLSAKEPCLPVALFQEICKMRSSYHQLCRAKECTRSALVSAGDDWPCPQLHTVARVHGRTCLQPHVSTTTLVHSLMCPQPHVSTAARVRGRILTASASFRKSTPSAHAQHIRSERQRYRWQEGR